MMRLVAVLVLLAGCASSPEVHKGPLQRGEHCLHGGTCAEGLTCIEYGGEDGPEVLEAVCDIPCSDAGCPPGESCELLVEGWGSVCAPTPGGE